MACLKMYRKVPIDRIPRDIHSFPQKWTYLATVNGMKLAANTQQSIKLQIGRVLNGLPPTDCSKCVYYMPPTPISIYTGCSRGMPCFNQANNQCPWFEVRT